MINFKRAKHWTVHTPPESAENIIDSCFTLTQIRLCQHVCITQWNTGIFREIYIMLYRVALQGIWNKKFHITSWIQLVLLCSLGFTLTKYNATSDNRSEFYPNREPHNFPLVHLNLYTKISCCCYTHTDVSSVKIFCMDFTAENKIFTTCMAGS